MATVEEARKRQRELSSPEAVEKYKQDMKKKRTIENEELFLKNKDNVKDLLKQVASEHRIACRESKLLRDLKKMMKESKESLTNSETRILDIKTQIAEQSPGRCLHCGLFGGHPDLECGEESGLQTNFDSFPTEAELIYWHCRIPFELTETDREDMERRSKGLGPVEAALVKIEPLYQQCRHSFRTYYDNRDGSTKEQRVKCLNDVNAFLECFHQAHSALDPERIENLDVFEKIISPWIYSLQQ